MESPHDRHRRTVDVHRTLAKLTSIGILAHMGLLWGPPNQLALAALAVGLLCVLFWGYRMAWLRRPARAFAPRGVFRGLSRPAGFAVVLMTVDAGWLMPVFGVSLVAFLLVDALLRRRAARGSVSRTG
ncbi:PepSY domain-containing protein [Pseudonocardia petroleophila]|uniref:PepSY domain-containing protein n=1 Tax=Pseudonocardia petroleophila TaxID=37331 RepID=UPI0034E2CF8E